MFSIFFIDAMTTNTLYLNQLLHYVPVANSKCNTNSNSCHIVEEENEDEHYLNKPHYLQLKMI